MPFPVDIKWVRETERKLRVEFPAAYVTSMVAMNGGSVGTSVDHFELFPLLDASDKKRIQRTCNSVDRETSTARKSNYGFPENAVVIGANGGGDLLILLPMDDRPDKLQHAIFWWDHETCEVSCVADDFSGLSKK
jgi:hypothetical protein